MGLKSNGIISWTDSAYVFTFETHKRRTCLFPAVIQFFSRTPKCPGSCPWGYAYPRLGITELP